MSTCPTCRTEHADGVVACPPDADTLAPDPALPGADPDLAPGTPVGEYRIEAKIGVGGFGTVYRAMHPVIGKAAAIKVLSRQCSANPQLVSRFVAEARAVNQIRHRNIIDIFSFGALEDGRHYYVMELLEGMTLDAYRRKRGRLPPAEALPILVKIARALDAAHAAGIAHRDLKPENVFLVFDEDGAIFPKLLDFGIAKLLGESSTTAHKTRTGHLIGTPLYMSPEQCRGRNVDHRTDVYSFGILAHELLAGAPPFDGESAFDLLIKHTSEPAPPVSSVTTHLSPALDAPLLRMLEKDPESRPASLLEATAALVEAARGAGYDVPTGLLRASDAAVGRGGSDAAGRRARIAAAEPLAAGSRRRSRVPSRTRAPRTPTGPRRCCSGRCRARWRAHRPRRRGGGQRSPRSPSSAAPRPPRSRCASRAASLWPTPRARRRWLRRRRPRCSPRSRRRPPPRPHRRPRTCPRRAPARRRPRSSSRSRRRRRRSRCGARASSSARRRGRCACRAGAP
ncbi:serine/threonine-protein kinase [Sorangium sp. So ce429]